MSDDDWSEEAILARFYPDYDANQRRLTAWWEMHELLHYILPPAEFDALLKDLWAPAPAPTMAFDAWPTRRHNALSAKIEFLKQRGLLNRAELVKLEQAYSEIADHYGDEGSSIEGFFRANSRTAREALRQHIANSPAGTKATIEGMAAALRDLTGLSRQDLRVLIGHLTKPHTVQGHAITYGELRRRIEKTPKR